MSAEWDVQLDNEQEDEYRQVWDLDNDWGFDEIAGEIDDDWEGGESAHTNPQPTALTSPYIQPFSSDLPPRQPRMLPSGLSHLLMGNNPSSSFDRPTLPPPFPPITSSNPTSHSGHDPRYQRHLPHPHHGSEDWFAPGSTRRQDSTFPSLNFGSQNQPSGASSPPSSYGSAIEIDDLLSEDEVEAEAEAEEEDMPDPRLRHGASRRNNPSTVDLTDLPSSPDTPHSPRFRQPTSIKRAAESSSSSSSRPRTPKRRRVVKSSEDEKENTPIIESLDLTNEAPSAEEELAQTQQTLLLAAQSSPQNSASSAPLRLGKRTCIICMEPFTNATVTACGHMYCHECLTQALVAGEKNSEKGIGNCPVCRKPVKRTKGNQMIPISFMKRAKWKGKGRMVRT